MTRSNAKKTIIIGAGIGGLSAAVDLAARGLDVTVLEQAFAPGGKLRQFPSDAGPVDAGPTVLTMRAIFDALFERAGARLDEHISLTPETVLARHWWQDGSTLDLFADPAESANAVADFAGREARAEFVAFSENARRLYSAFNGPVMQSAVPSLGALSRVVMSDARRLLPAMAPLSTLAQSLSRSFTDPRLRQLFGRYATYVGGSPFSSPAILSLIWDVESQGVWRIKNGMLGLAKALEKVATERGATFQYGATVDKIFTVDGRVGGVVLDNGERIEADNIIFNGDPAALSRGLLGEDSRRAVKRDAVTPRSLSAYVWAFAARPKGVDLRHHNVFFGHQQKNEFDAVARGDVPDDPTLYVCAQDRGEHTTPPENERFEIIMNGAPLSGKARMHAQAQDENPEEFLQCRTRTFQTLQRMGLDFDVIPQRLSLITPSDFAARFPASDGSLYGRSPHGMKATFQRPTTRSRVKGLYLAGGGVHPGAGLPMASLSGQHAAAAIITDLALTSRSRRTATPGGTSTASRMMASGQSRSSGS